MELEIVKIRPMVVTLHVMIMMLEIAEKIKMNVILIYHAYK